MSNTLSLKNTFVLFPALSQPGSETQSSIQASYTASSPSVNEDGDIDCSKQMHQLL